LTILILFCSTNFSQEDFYGIKIHSKDKNVSERSSIALNEGKPIELKDKFSVSFDISFWSLKYFGPVFRASKDNKEFLRLIFNHFQDKDFYLLQLFPAGISEPLVIKLDKKSFALNKWINIKIELDTKKDFIALYLNNQLVEQRPFIIPDTINLSMYFGLIDPKNPMDYDVPAFCLKNILIEENKNRRYWWPLNPLDKDFLYDKFSNSKIELINTDLLINDHFHWYKKIQIEVNNYPLFTYDSVNSRIFIDDKQRLITLDLISLNISELRYKNSRPGKLHDLIYDNLRNRFYSLFVAKGQVSTFDFLSGKWTEIDTSTEIEGHYYGSVKFLNPFDSTIYLFGGYGWYTSKKNLFKYDFNKDKWEEVKLTKNIGYRFNTSTSIGFDNQNYLFWGGIGNYTGKQEEGFFPFYDLYSFDLVNKKFTKIYEFKNTELLKIYSHLFPNFYLNRSDSVFYFMKGYNDEKKFYFQLFKADLKNSEITKVGEQISINSIKSFQNVYFCFDQKTNEFIFIQYDDSSKVNVWGLKYPPVQESIFAAIKPSNDSNKIPFIILISIVTTLIIGFVFSYLKKNRNKKVGLSYNYDSSVQKPVKKNYIKTFGGLCIFNDEGKDVFGELSPKLKEVFTLIFIRSFSNHNKGITSDELSSILWPDASPENAKSNRGVAINKLRKAISDVKGIHIDFSNKLWMIKTDNLSDCDFQEYSALRNQILNENKNGFMYLNQLLNLVSDGEFLEGLSYEWLDSYKLAVNNEVIILLKKFLSDLEKDNGNNSNLKLKICDTILKFDRVEEETFKMKIRLHYETGNHELAKTTYKLFVAEYQRLYDEKYPFSIQEILSSK
jgi:two-component SAPR family response regulator